jgi:hypothetical protein
MKIIGVLAGVAMTVVLAAPAAADRRALPESGCNIRTTRDLIIWERFPRVPDSAIEVGDADLARCAPTLNTWREGQPSGPGYCSKIAWASDNPAYDTEARPAPPLQNVLDQVGDC